MKLRKLSDSKVQLMLANGSPVIATFKEGKLSSTNVVKSRKAVTNLVSCANAKDDNPILLEQSCTDFKNCDNVMSISKGSNQHNYEATGQHGLISQAWAFCDKDDPEAFQLLLRSQDGSLVSLTPLGNVMWQREDGLSSINTVKLIDKDSSDEEYDTEEIDSEHVLDMLLKRLKHHGSQLHLLIERIQQGKVGLSTLLLGNPDTSYDDFGMRKVITALTDFGSLYGIDSKSGKVLWQVVTSCESAKSSFKGIFLQRAATHHGSLASLICNVESSAQILTFDPMTGKIKESKIVQGRVLRANLLHHSSPEDNIKPILLHREDQGFALEPPSAAKHLEAVSGKMFIASLDANGMGLHGYQLMINKGQIDKVPVWSFASSGAKILHLIAKPIEEVVHSQGRVMADRSVLFKYINPNLAFIISEGQDSSGKNFVNIYLLDLVTGRILFSANHKRVQGPYHAVHSENWVVYTYFNEKSRRAELGSLELFEGKTQSNSSVFSSLHNNISPLVERQSYILGKTIHLNSV